MMKSMLRRTSKGGSGNTATTISEENAAAFAVPSAATPEHKLPPKVVKFRSAVEKVMTGDAANTMSSAFVRAFAEVSALIDSGEYSLDEAWDGGVGTALALGLQNPLLAKYCWKQLVRYCRKKQRRDLYFLPEFGPALTREIIAKNLDAIEIYFGIANEAELAETIAKLPGVINALVTNILDDPKSEHARISLNALCTLSNFTQAHLYILADERAVDAMLVMMEENVQNSLASTMALANLVGKDEVKSELLRNVKGAPLLNIVAILEAHAATEDITATAFTYIWYLYEPLLPLRWLCIPPQNRALLGPKLFPLLSAALKKAIKLDDALSAGSTVNILAHYAFDTDYLIKLKADKELLGMLEDILDKKKDIEAWRKCAHDAQGLLWTLKGGDQLEVPASAIKSNQVMISYNWAHKALAIRVHSFFTSIGFQVWRDDDKINEHFMESMAQAVAESAAIVVLVSPQYKESANCQREALFASKREKKIIPLLVVEGYSGEGWLELLIAPLMQYDITRNFESVMRTVYEKELKSLNGGSSPRAYAAMTKRQLSYKTQAVLTTEQLVNSLKQYPGLDGKVADAFHREEIDGDALETLLVAWHGGQIRFNEVREWFNVSSIGQLMKLKRALDGIASAHNFRIQ